MSEPLVSIIIPTYNRSAFLPAALNSVLAQDYQAKEIIVVDDGSTDDTVEVCNKYPVKYFRQENRGGSAARNLGVAHCSGELLNFFDDDDLCAAGSVRERVEQWQRDSGCAFILGRLRRFTEETPGCLHFTDPEEGILLPCMGPALVKRSVYEEVGGLNETLQMGDGGEDIDFWQRLHEAGHTNKYIEKVCIFYRRHPGNATGDPRIASRGVLRAVHEAIKRKRLKQEIAS